ncbi:hypothetical protein ZOSMA_351G00170 [Zostera marina]|uniref:Uncharacterized protein n=1 Tax=Zostera marina TaxID=29655 RepID=A0A0K9P6Q4_ZOSMR|nr:hypothetical protein ZOSMA_351G00170 [Zostera marina]
MGPSKTGYATDLCFAK